MREREGLKGREWNRKARTRWARDRTGFATPKVLR